MRLAPFNPWGIANPTLPKFYWEVKSPEQLIANVYCILNALKDYTNDVSDTVNGFEDRVSNLEDLFNQFMESGFDDYYREQIEQWIRDNLAWLWQTFAQMVFFGLTSDGHFCAYVPESWSDIVFDTGAVYGTEQYGRLILRYNTSGEGVIDNTSDYYPGIDVTEQLEQMNARINRLNHTVYTALHTNDTTE